MEETKPIPSPAAERTVDTLAREYSQLCTKLGHLNHQIESLRRDSDLVLNSMRDLDFEFARVRQTEQEEAAKKAAETSNVVPINADAAPVAASN